jgi:hypothetical protein
MCLALVILRPERLAPKGRQDAKRISQSIVEQNESDNCEWHDWTHRTLLPPLLVDSIWRSFRGASLGVVGSQG